MSQDDDGATTGSDGAAQASVPAVKRTATPDRLEKLGYPKLRERNELVALTGKQRLLIEYMTHGCRHEFVTRIGKQPGEPLSLIEAADLLRIKRRNARGLFSAPLFKKELGLAMERIRSGEAIASLRTVVAMRDEPGEGKAADRKVRLEASSILLGDAVSKGSGGVSVAVSVTNNVVAPGYVIDLTPDGAALERAASLQATKQVTGQGDSKTLAIDLTASRVGQEVEG